jgi:hypothetical protein
MASALSIYVLMPKCKQGMGDMVLPSLSLLFKSLCPFYLFGFHFLYIISQAIPVVGFVSFILTFLFFFFF